MKLHNKIFLVSASVLMTMSLASPVMSNVNARHRYHYRTTYVKHTRRLSKAARRKIRRLRARQAKRARAEAEAKTQNSGTQSNVKTIQTRTAYYINQVRSKLGLNTLNSTPGLQKIANRRARYCARHETIRHHDIDGNNYVQPMLKDTLHYDGAYSEVSGVTFIRPWKAFTTSTVESGDSTPSPLNSAKQINNNADDTAYSIINDMVNHDAPQYGHRSNIINPCNSRMAIGVAYSPKNKGYYVIGDFIQGYPQYVMKKLNGRYYAPRDDNYKQDMPKMSQKQLRTLYKRQTFNSILDDSVTLDM